MVGVRVIHVGSLCESLTTRRGTRGAEGEQSVVTDGNSKAPSPTPAVRNEGNSEIARPAWRCRAPRSSMACRICLEVGTEELVQKCACRGTQAWVHESCLASWRRGCEQVFDAIRCRTCGDDYRDALTIEILREDLEVAREELPEVKGAFRGSDKGS